MTMRGRKTQVGRPCPYCKRTMLSHKQALTTDEKMQSASVEHIIPRVMGGDNDPLNIMIACQRCNNLRGHVPYEAFMKFSRVVIQKFPDAPSIYLRQALDRFLMHLVETACKNKMALRQASSISLLMMSDIDKGN